MSVSGDIPAKQLAPKSELATPTGRMLGDVLLQMGKISQADVEKILAYQREQRTTFGRAAVALKLVTDSDVMAAVARQFHYPIAQEGDYLQTVSPELVVAHAPFSVAAERIRSIRTTLLHKWLGKGQRTLVVLGTEPKAGATYLACNLAVAFAQMGLPTVLVDTNMRRPRVAEMFALPPRREGLSSMLLGQDSAMSGVLRDVLPNLTLIPAGSEPPNPQELLSTNEFVILTEALKARFDVVIFDTPAGNGLADSAIVSARAGNVLLVARQHRTPLENLRRMARIRETGCEIVGTVMNTF